MNTGNLLSASEVQQMLTGQIKKDNIQTHGIDLNVIELQKIHGGGAIPKTGKTTLAKYEKVELTTDREQQKNYWILSPGPYDVKFAQGCKIPLDAMMLIKQRSSLLRNGTILQSSLFDAGFETQNIGTVMIVHVPILIEYQARVGCAYAHRCEKVQDPYDGQWMNDKQRKQ